jgi:hypothetical protein
MRAAPTSPSITQTPYGRACKQTANLQYANNHVRIKAILNEVFLDLEENRRSVCDHNRSECVRYAKQM